jgi:hypothetical protein
MELCPIAPERLRPLTTAFQEIAACCRHLPNAYGRLAFFTRAEIAAHNEALVIASPDPVGFAWVTRSDVFPHINSENTLL